MLVGVASHPPEYRHFTVETGKTAHTFATQCMYTIYMNTNNPVSRRQILEANFLNM